MKKVSKWVLGIAVLLIVTIIIVYFAFIQRQGPVNKLFGRLSPSTVSSISIEAGVKETVLEEDDKRKLIELLRKEHYEENDDPTFASWTWDLNDYRHIRIQTKTGADIYLIITSQYCICCPDQFDGDATSESEVKGYPVSKDGSDAHQQVLDFIDGLLLRYFSE